MSIACGFRRLARRYEKKMKLNHSEMVENRDFHITQLREAIECTEKILDITYEELENWSCSMQSLYEVDEFDNIFQRVELVFLKIYVNWRYNQALNEIMITEDAKARLQKILNKLEVLNAFKRI